MDRKNETNEELSDEELAGVSGGYVDQTGEIRQLLQEAGFEDVDSISNALEQLGIPISIYCYSSVKYQYYYTAQNGNKLAITYKRFMDILTEELIKRGLLTRP